MKNTLQTEFNQYFNNHFSTNEELLKFFIVFSKFEYSLKKSGYLKQNERKTISIDWNRFINDIKVNFEKLENKNIFTNIIKLKPKKQILDNEKLSWIEINVNSNSIPLETIIDYVKCIRNNLFHGGKYPNMVIKEYSRDSELLSLSVKVIHCIIELNPKVHLNYKRCLTQ
jgi:hypothetical protein